MNMERRNLQFWQATGDSTEEKIDAFKVSRLRSLKCKACGEPVYHSGYCTSCTIEIQSRINKLKKLYEKEPAEQFKQEYAVIRLSQD